MHARSVVACALDGDTGEVFERRLSPDYQDVLEWLRSLPGRVAVSYEAGPTGFGLARFLLAAGVMSGGRAVEAGAPVGGSGQDRCP